MDRINASGSPGSFPINQALRAYAQTPRVNKPGGSPFVKSVQPIRPSTRPDTIAKISPTKKSPSGARSIDQLVGGKVMPIDLGHDVTRITGPKPITTSAGTYAMFPHAADRNLAATGVSLGRSLDLRG